MSRWSTLTGIAIIGVLSGLMFGTLQAASPDPASVSTSLLPDDPHRALVIRTCLSCHPVEIVAAQKRTPDKWDEILARMKDHGAVATEDELDQIFAYLIKHLNSESASKP